MTIDAQGQILERNKLRRGGGLVRVAPPPSPGAAHNGGGPRYARPDVPLPLHPDDTKLRPNDWNQVEIFFDANIVRTFLNNGHEFGAVGDEGYGPIALYAGGSGEVRFKSVALSDIGLKVRQPEEVSKEFRKQRLSDFYYSWGSAAADFNHDGILDVVSGPYIYYGPDYLEVERDLPCPEFKPNHGVCHRCHHGVFRRLHWRRLARRNHGDVRRWSGRSTLCQSKRRGKALGQIHRGAISPE